MMEKPSGEAASNKISLSGTNKESVSQEIEESVGVHVSEGSGAAVGEKGSVTIRKLNDQGQVLTGAQFELLNQIGSQILRQGTVDDEGKLSFGKLPYGTYLLKETAAPSGHKLADDLVTGRKIKVDQTTSTVGNYLDIVNESTKVSLVKQTEDGTKLSGARFRVEKSVDGQWKQALEAVELTTDNKGKLTVSGLEAGKYRFIEVAAPTSQQEYILNTEPLEFEVVTLANGQTPDVTVGPMINYLGSASFIKRDGEDINKTLAGATFSISRTQNSIGQTIKEKLSKKVTSDENGKVTLTDLSPGEYEITEVTAPTGYVLNTEKIRFQVVKENSGKPTELKIPDFNNYQGSVELTKYGADFNGKKTIPLSDANFDIIDSNGKIVKTIISSEDGKAYAKGLAPGKYTLKETKAPSGYILNTENIRFEIKKETQGKPKAISLGDFLNYQGSIQMKKINSDYEGLADAEFTLYLVSDHGNTHPLGVYRSDKLGQITVSELSPGKYKLIETKAPFLEGTTEYVKNKYPQFFDISDEYRGEFKPLNLGEYQNFRGKAIISKGNGEEEGQFLSGAEFELYQLMENDEQKLVKKVTSDDAGQLDLYPLGAGYYKLIEVKAPDGYVINENQIFITVEENSGGNQVEDQFTFQNYQANIKFTKKNIEGKPLSGATFGLYQIDETSKEKVVTENLIDTNNDGTYEYDGLGSGKFVIKELQAPEGYIRNTEEQKVTINSIMNENDTIELPDYINYQAQATLTKMDEAGKGIQGAEFTVFKDGKQVQTVISDKNGVVTFIKLGSGAYTIEETKALSNYILNTKKLSFTIAESLKGKEALVPIKLSKFINYQGSVEVLKVDSQDKGKRLSGAQFKLEDEHGNIIAETITTDAEGQVVIEHLKPGSYFLIETRAPKGYKVGNNKTTFTILEKAEDRPKRERLTVLNDPKESQNLPSETKYNSQLPNNGDSESNIGLFIGLITMLITGLSFALRRKGQNYSK